MTAPQDADINFTVFRDRIVVSDGRNAMINKCEDLEVDNADGFT